ncbi:hypothetical protein JVX92_15000 (plasmid) [Microbacterium hominis]|uniref:hypothetical protein n=1 Tax=Microbacterium hominis TaxID=162426 RepID=UPI0019655E9B|nr:hypothetical protein [Microbacterium hominis]QRY42343.1 hypothetical protein JVX92_15000 [Microbacterium hominis]
MSSAGIEHDVTLWLVDEQPARMFYAGRRWTVTDTPTPLRDSVWSVTPEQLHESLYGWRFQGTDPQGESLVFDVYGGAGEWHVHRTYA